VHRQYNRRSNKITHGNYRGTYRRSVKQKTYRKEEVYYERK